jgi:manganese efflux pump family protein
MIALLLVAASVGLSNFAAAIGIGVAGVDARLRLRVGLVFGLFEAGMPVLGLLIGRQVAVELGHATRWLGAALLIAVGGYGIVKSIQTGSDVRSAAKSPRPSARPSAVSTPARLLLSGLALSIDNLVVGFALGTYRVNILTGAAIFGGVSVVLALAGLELGAMIGQRAGNRGEQIGGAILISVGVAIAAGALS